jgi:Mce-associated membrane protein
MTQREDTERAEDRAQARTGDRIEDRPEDREESRAEGGEGFRAGRSRVSVRRAGFWALTLAALAFCAVAGRAYWQARDNPTTAYARARDAALADGSRDVAALSSMDALHIDSGLTTWLGASTGPLHDELRRTGGQNRTALRKAGTTVRGTVTDAALTALDTRAGTATLIATVQVESAPRTGSTTTDRKRFEAGLARTPAGWKLTALTAVPVGTD